MKHLLKHLSPFAPDQSGASAVLYELGGITVICDAGGCAGNICGFDEPRWFEKKSALFSAGLRDMDAILGRDDRLAQKLSHAAEQIKAQFTAVIGTPVPAVIATDFRALKRIVQRRTGLPALAVECTGTNYYDVGEEVAYLELFKTFAAEKFPVEKGRIGVIGATPLEISDTSSEGIICELKKQGWEDPVTFGMGSGIEDIRRASQCEKILVISPAGIKAAEYLKNKFGIPYEADFPCRHEFLDERLGELRGKKILVVHQQIIANSIRKKLIENGADRVDCASWFMMKQELCGERDLRIADEEDFSEAVQKGGYDYIIGDKSLARIRGIKVPMIDCPHFALSGRSFKQVNRDAVG